MGTDLQRAPLMNCFRGPATVLLTVMLLASFGCDGGGATTAPTPEQAASTPPLPTPTQQNSAGFSAPKKPPE